MMRLLHWLLCLLPVAAGAQGLADPTRPPGALAEMTETATGGGGPVLQSVMLSPTRKVAVISGEMVVLGGSYGGARLVRLTETEAVLQSGGERMVLRLHPQVDKKPASGKAANTAKK
jgi:MSHA biogenesis protein MshK